MAQFDVFRNTGPHGADIPYVVVVQSSRLANYRRRVVVPLVLASRVGPVEPSLNPRFRIEGVDVVLHPLEMVSVAAERLAEKVGSLKDEGGRIITSIDLVFSQAWG